MRYQGLSNNQGFSMLAPRLLPAVAIAAALVLASNTNSDGDEKMHQHVRLTAPRLEPLEESQWNQAQRELLGPLARAGRADNVFTTLVRHEDLYRSWITFGSHILGRSTLPARDRELLILRIGWRCRAEYEWGQHTRIARRIGFTEDEIRRITKGPDAPGWTDFEAALLRAADELRDDAFITDETWKALAKRYDEKQMMDLVFTVGQYNLVSMALNTFGVQLDEGLTGFPDPRE